MALNNSAAYLIALNRYEDAREYAREAIDIARSLRYTARLVLAVQHLAAVAALEPREDPNAASDARRLAARLMGFADTKHATFGTTRDQLDGLEHRRVMAALRSALATADLEALLADGATLSDDEAAGAALRI